MQFCSFVGLGFCSYFYYVKRFWTIGNFYRMTMQFCRFRILLFLLCKALLDHWELALYKYCILLYISQQEIICSRACCEKIYINQEVHKLSNKIFPSFVMLLPVERYNYFRKATENFFSCLVHTLIITLGRSGEFLKVVQTLNCISGWHSFL